MTRPFTPRACAAYAFSLVAGVSAAMPLSAAAQQEVAATTPSVLMKTEIALPVRLQVGDATRDLLSLQREGHAASQTPRPLAGDVASLSYQRYLDSFKFPIPEKFTATVQKSGSSNGSR